MSFDLEATYLALDGKGGVVEMPVTADFWERIESSPAAAHSMMGVFPVRTDWSHWEMHPDGDEVLVLIDGRLDMLLDDGREQRTIAMQAGATLIVPAGVWHRALVRAPGRLLGFTYGPGTRHRPV
ncbi:MAG TPA: cupin domain-containing protein [Terricaulis sp.]|nr:cupin domain-containing protein [Terricaulis sp.]